MPFDVPITVNWKVCGSLVPLPLHPANRLSPRRRQGVALRGEAAIATSNSGCSLLSEKEPARPTTPAQLKQAAFGCVAGCEATEIRRSCCVYLHVNGEAELPFRVTELARRCIRRRMRANGAGQIYSPVKSTRGIDFELERSRLSGGDTCRGRGSARDHDCKVCTRSGEWHALRLAGRIVVIVSDPISGPPLVGWKVTPTVQLVPAARLAPQEDVSANSPDGFSLRFISDAMLD